MTRRNKKKSRINPQKPSNSSNIPDSALQIKSDKGKTDHLNPTFSFKYADDNKYCFSDWPSRDLKVLKKGLQKIEKYTWSQIKTHGSKTRGDSVGTGYKLIFDHPDLPESVSEDHDISEMRIDNTKRIFGFRNGSIYHLIWFDLNHDICS